ncbi:pilus assembly protein PilA [Mesorhizobium sp. Root157]|uniref:Flp family type IVb pilin n=1 Tax=Mesorhizobium sp. Root157 TaxID=1736477 RepID=UPI0006FCECC0|nr:Flp family type IVb pilin [Mesorhizobium sp. Root157]KQZ80835.1 pilus assembly protein PilA [Mesorhizobium sp. Root157]
MARLLQEFLSDDRGATAIEYGLIVAVLSLVIIAGVGVAADSLVELWNGNNSELAKVFR